MRRTLLTILFSLVIASLGAHPWKPRHYVIIDSDGGIDDLKAICMLMASPDVRILAITASDGFHKAPVAYGKLRGLADGLHHEGLPVAGPENAVTLIEKMLASETTPVKFLSLGSLKTAAEAMEQAPSFAGKVKQIYWSNSGLPGKEGSNYKSDPASAEKVLAGKIPVTVTGGGGDGFYDVPLLDAISHIHSPYAEKARELINSMPSHSFVYTAFDEMVPLLLHFPELFSPEGSDESISYRTPSDIDGLRTAALKMLRGETVERMQTIKRMPSDTSFYMPDIQPFVTEIRNRYGEDEWTSGVIANELHRHLGVFAIIGVKMGIRAREYFCTGVDEMEVTTLAGSTPPLSCMNDGIQVSTGATPGHGLLTVSRQQPCLPAADFTHKEQTIRITLKKELADRVSAELKEINFIYGLDSDIYWELVRNNSIKYWLQFDRHEIFDIEVIK
ncbi:MAG: nucleoside hydrolase [Bacteroidales bacterium]|nr:nucleoside hydrolase [Bacteroidales bacterium]